MNKIMPAKGFVAGRLIPDMVLIFFLLLAAVKLTYSMEAIIDITYCAGGYIGRGLKLTSKGLPHAEYAPLYTIWYYLLSFFEKDSVWLYYLNYKILVAATTLGIYAYLRRLGVVTYICGAAAFLYLVSGTCRVWQVHGKLVTHFSLLVLLFFLITSTFTKTRVGYFCVMGFGILAASFVRPELFVSFIFFGLVFLFYILRKIKNGSMRQGSDLGRVIVFLILCSSMFYAFGNPLSGNRSWAAFSRQFSVNYNKRGGLLAGQPEKTGEAVIVSAFPGADNVTAAAFINSKEFFRHMLSNLSKYLYNSVDILLIDVSRHTAPLLNSIIRWVEASFFLLTGFYLIKKLPQLKDRRCGTETTYRVALVTLVLLIPSFLAGLIIYPRRYYLVTQGAMLIVIFSYFLGKAAGSPDRKRQERCRRPFFTGFLILVLTPGFYGGWFFPPAKAGTDETARQVNVKTIRFIRSLNIEERLNILTNYSRDFIFLDDNYNNIYINIKRIPFNGFIKNFKIGIILLDKPLGRDERLVNDNEFKYFLKHYRSYGFTRLDIPDTENSLFVKDELLDKR